MNTRMTKRSFLQHMGAVAGVGVLYRSLKALDMGNAGAAHAAPPELPRGSGRGKQVVILGAGLSGMVAAYELSKAGYRCTILEATGRAGGRSLTVRGGDMVTETDSRQTVNFDDGNHLYANLGPARIPYHHRIVLGYCKAFGVELEVFTNDNRAALFHNRERFDGKPLAGRQVLTDTRGYIAELLAKAAKAGTLDGELTPDDKERLLEMLIEYGDLKPDHLYKGSSRGGYRGEQLNAGTKAGDVNDPLDFSELLRSDFWEYKLHFDDSLDQNPTLLQPVGGMDAIVKAFEQRVGSRIRYHQVVEEIRNTSDGVRVTYKSARSDSTRVIEADFAVCTIPAPVLKDIPNNFSRDVQAAIAGVAFEPAMKIAFQTHRRFWEDDHAIYGGISWTDQDITQIWYPPYGYHRQDGVILGAYIWDEAPCLRFAALSPEQRLRTAVAEGSRLHPGYEEEIKTGVSRSWLKVPFQKGGWPIDAAPDLLLKPDGAVFFAGDQASAMGGWQEGAAVAAHAAVRGISQRVR